MVDDEFEFQCLAEDSDLEVTVNTAVNFRVLRMSLRTRMCWSRIEWRDPPAGFTQRKHVWPVWRRTVLFAIICIPVPVCSDNEKSVLVQEKNHLSVVCRKFSKRPVSLFIGGKTIKDFFISCSSGMKGNVGTKLQVGGGRELQRWWRSDRWDGCGDQIEGAMVEVREMGRLWRLERWGDGGSQRDGTVVEIGEMGRWWRSERWDGCGDQRKGRCWRSERWVGCDQRDGTMVEVRDGRVVEIREMGGCGDQRKGRCWRSERWDVVEIREKGRWWRSERWVGGGVKETKR